MYSARVAHSPQAKFGRCVISSAVTFCYLRSREGERERGRKGTKEGEGKSSGPREPRRPRRSLFDRLDLLCFAGQGQSSLEVVGTAAIMELGRSRARPKMKPKILPLDAKPRKNPKYDKIGPQVDTGYNARKQLER